MTELSSHDSSGETDGFQPEDYEHYSWARKKSFSAKIQSSINFDNPDDIHDTVVQVIKLLSYVIDKIMLVPQIRVGE